MDQLLDVARVPVTFTPDLGVMQGANPCYVVCCAVRCDPPTTASAGFARFTVSRTKDDGSRLGISTVGGPSRLFAVGGERRPGKSMCRRIGNSAMDVPSHLLAPGPAASRWVVARSERIAGMRSASDPQDR